MFATQILMGSIVCIFIKYAKTAIKTTTTQTEPEKNLQFEKHCCSLREKQTKQRQTTKTPKNTWNKKKTFIKKSHKQGKEWQA